MHRTSLSSIVIISATLLIGLICMVFPLPPAIENYRPEVLLLILIYWAIYAPERVGMGVGCCSGLLLDVLQGSLLGEYALVGLITTYVANQFHRRLKLFGLLQQELFVFLLLGIQFILVMWIQSFVGHPVQSWQYGLPVVVSTALWPLCLLCLRWLQRKYKGLFKSFI